MKEQMKRAMVFGLAVMLAAPAAQIVTQQDALAGPFDTLSGSRSGGKRTNKQKSKKDKKEASKKKSKSSTTRRTTTTRSTTTTRNRTTRSTPTRRSTSRTTATTRRRVDDRRTVRCTSSGRCDNEPRAVGNTTRRPVNSRTTTTTTTRTRRPVNTRTTTTRTTTRRPVNRTTTRRTTYRSGRTTSRTHHHHSSTTVNNHYYSNNSTTTRYYGRSTRSGAGVATSSPASQRGATTMRDSERELYLTGGMGLSGINASQVADAPLPGLDFNVGVGAKRRLIVGELGFGVSGYRFDPEQAANTADLTLVSLTGDLKLQPKLAFIEPYVSAGLGGHVFNNHTIDEGAVGASLRLGAGVDLRFDTVAVSAQYQRNFLGLVGDERIYEDGAMSASTETLGLGLKIYF